MVVVVVAQSGQSGGQEPVPCMIGKGGLSSDDDGVPFDDGVDSRIGGGLRCGGVEQLSEGESRGEEEDDDDSVDGLDRRRGWGRGGP